MQNQAPKEANRGVETMKTMMLAADGPEREHRRGVRR